MIYVNVALLENGKKGNSFTDELKNVSVDMFDGASPGETYLLEFVEMSEEEFKKLPEFEGF